MLTEPQMNIRIQQNESKTKGALLGAASFGLASTYSFLHSLDRLQMLGSETHRTDNMVVAIAITPVLTLANTSLIRSLDETSLSWFKSL